ncbi:MAG: phosphotransferase [Thermoanaerobaculia bacterium]
MSAGSAVLTNEVLVARAGAWLQRRGLPFDRLEALAGDVSPRRYLRASSGGRRSAIVAHYPAEMRATARRFEESTALLAAHGVRVPAILESDAEAGWMAVEDLGPRTLHETGAGWAQLRPYYDDALVTLRRIASLPRAAVIGLGSPPLDAALLRRELDPCLELFLLPRGLAGDPPALADALTLLCERLAEDAAVPCHRDFMARNLVPLAERRVGVLDHQDLRLGPPAYDLASLLNDSLFPDRDLEEELLTAGLQPDVAREQYSRTVAQRALKAVGTYSAFAARGATRHLPLVAPTLARAERHLLALPETAEIVAPLVGRWRSAAV